MKTLPIHPSQRKAEGERDILKQRMERRFSSSDLPEKPGFSRKFGSFRFPKRGFNAKSMPLGADGTETNLRSKSTHSTPKSKKRIVMHASFFITLFDHISSISWTGLFSKQADFHRSADHPSMKSFCPMIQ